MFFRYLAAELFKLRRSLVLLLVLLAPLLVTIITVLLSLDSKRPVPLDQFAMTGAAFWAFAMLPLAVTALSVLMAQMEHGPRTWDHLLALPGARRHLFAAKMTMVMALVAAMSGWLWLLLFSGARIVAALHPVTGDLDAATIAGTLANMAVASLLMCVVQTWTALRFRSFVPPLVLGILGTFVSVAAAGAHKGAYFPWLMPVQMLATDAGMQRMALLLGAGGGGILLALMLADLSRREA